MSSLLASLFSSRSDSSADSVELKREKVAQSHQDQDQDDADEDDVDMTGVKVDQNTEPSQPCDQPGPTPSSLKSPSLEESVAMQSEQDWHRDPSSLSANSPDKSSSFKHPASSKTSLNATSSQTGNSSSTSAREQVSVAQKPSAEDVGTLDGLKPAPDEASSSDQPTSAARPNPGVGLEKSVKQPRATTAKEASSVADMTAATEPKRRTMPARLRRVSSLLAGSTLEEELLDTQERMGDNKVLLPPDTKLVLSNIPAVRSRAYLVEDAAPSAEAAMSVFADAQVARACRATATIETPDFCLRDDTEMMGKTRNLRNEEDTSDAEYERRHRRPDNLEKKQRRMEKERLVRDRQKLKERIEQLKSVDPRLLMPILTARDQSKASSSSQARDPLPRGSEAALGLGKNNLSTDAAASLVRLENLRKELLDEAYETLARYDILLPSTSGAPSAEKRRKTTTVADETPQDSGQEDSEPTVRMGRQILKSVSLGSVTRKVTGASPARSSDRSTHSRPESGRFASGSTSRSTANSMREASPVRASPRRIVSKRGSSNSLNEPKSGSQPVSTPEMKKVAVSHLINSSGKKEIVYATPTHHNIHARTSGGRFAPKAAVIGLSPSTPSRPAKAKEPAMKKTPSRSPQRRKRAPAPASISTSQPKEPLREPSGRLSRRRSRSRADRSPESPEYPTLVPTGVNKTGPSLAEIKATERRPKRVKLIFNRSGGTGISSSPSTSGNGSGSNDINGSGSAGMAEQLDSPLSVGSPIHTPNGDSTVPALASALTLEQAKAMMEAAMAAAEAEGEQSFSGFFQRQPSPARPQGQVEQTQETMPQMSSFPAGLKTETVDDIMDLDHSGPDTIPCGIQGQENDLTGDRKAEESGSAVESGESRANAQDRSIQEQQPETDPGNSRSVPARHMPGRTIEPRSKAAEAIPSRRNSTRVKAISAFGEKIPAYVTKKMAFEGCVENTMIEEGWNEVVNGRLACLVGQNDPLPSPDFVPEHSPSPRVGGSDRTPPPPLPAEDEPTNAPRIEEAESKVPAFIKEERVEMKLERIEEPVCKAESDFDMEEDP
ncbi:hypothetical protein IE53DRAFT_361131 [Violaceomyces palustris]|uniref:Uncharacterized protein n=1 Tax=Violaceomyces palustris TaxID=1673888 RepID=A0ACD0P1G6_9BASI|nr:hypothetical protein IE53DRAFT_361131 [Violaceomyces palustris]